MPRSTPDNRTRIASPAAARRERIVLLADLQGGCVHRSQLLHAGISGAAISRRIASGELFPRHRGVHAVGRRVLDARGEAWAALLGACGGIDTDGRAARRAALAEGSALAAMGLCPHPPSPIVVVRGGPLTLRGVTVRTTRRLPVGELACTDGLWHTCFERTMLDLAPRSSVAELQDVLDRAERHLGLDIDALDAAIDSARGRQGLRKLRRALEPFRALAGEDLRSLLERFAAHDVRRSDLPDPEINGVIALGTGRSITVDLVFRAARGGVEIDGRASHSRAVQFGRDRERDRELQKLGWVVLRFTWQDVRHRPAAVLRDIAAFVDASGSRRAA